jgi:hypothetical protein
MRIGKETVMLAFLQKLTSRMGKWQVCPGREIRNGYLSRSCRYTKVITERHKRFRG